MAGNDGTTRLIARREGALGWLILNNPARHNALSLEMYEALGRRVEEFAGEPEIRAIIVTGKAAAPSPRARISPSSSRSAPPPRISPAMTGSPMPPP